MLQSTRSCLVLQSTRPWQFLSRDLPIRILASRRTRGGSSGGRGGPLDCRHLSYRPCCIRPTPRLWVFWRPRPELIWWGSFSVRATRPRPQLWLHLAGPGRGFSSSRLLAASVHPPAGCGLGPRAGPSSRRWARSLAPSRGPARLARAAAAELPHLPAGRVRERLAVTTSASILALRWPPGPFRRRVAVARAVGPP